MNSINYVFVVVIVILIAVILSSWRRVNYICNILDEVHEGNLNQRIRFQNHIKVLGELSIKINRMIQNLQKVDASNKQSQEARKKMISNISHDFRTPLTSMLGYMELIINDDTLDNNEKTKYLKIVNSKGIYLYNLMEEFFQVAKLDSNDVKLDIKEINLSETLRQNIVSFFSEVKKLNIEIEIRIPEEDIYALGDEKALNRILSNLISNAIKHGSKATIIGVQLNCDEKNAFVSIYDNGIGIPSDEINYIFDRLYTVERSRNLSMKSSGLGLTIVEKLVKSLGGTILVEAVNIFVYSDFLLRNN